MSSAELLKLENLSQMLAKEGAGPAWVRELALHAVLVAVSHQKVADAKNRDQARLAVADLGDVVNIGRQRALHHADYQSRIASLVKDAANLSPRPAKAQA